MFSYICQDMTWKGFFRKADPVLFLMLIYFLWILTLKNRDDGGFTDFNVFFNAGRRLLAGENIYADPHLFSLRYFYSPLFAGIMAMAQDMGLIFAKNVWFFITALLLFRVMVMLKNQVPRNSKWRFPLFFILLFLMSKIILFNFMSHQMTILLLWTILESYLALEKKRYWLSAFILCLGINFKVLPIVVVPYFLYISANKLQYLLAGITALLFYTFIPAAFIGWDYNLELLADWVKTLNPVSEVHVMQTYENGILDVSSMVTKYLSDEPVYKEPDIHIAAWPVGALFALTNFIRLACLAGAVWLVYKVKSDLYGFNRHFIILAAFMALAPLCFPHQREYSFLLYLPMWLVFLNVSVKSRSTLGILVFSVSALVSGLLTWTDFVGPHIVEVFNHYRIITMGMLMMYVGYVWFVVSLNQAHENSSLKNQYS